MKSVNIKLRKMTKEYINVIGAGHYETEIIGVNLLMKKIQEELKIDCEFIDVPTEL